MIKYSANRTSRWLLILQVAIHVFALWNFMFNFFLNELSKKKKEKQLRWITILENGREYHLTQSSCLIISYNFALIKLRNTCKVQRINSSLSRLKSHSTLFVPTVVRKQQHDSIRVIRSYLTVIRTILRRVRWNIFHERHIFPSFFPSTWNTCSIWSAFLQKGKRKPSRHRDASITRHFAKKRGD